MSLLAAYQTIRKTSEAMCHPLLTEDYIPQPIEYVSPPRWNLAHTSWFFEEFILKPHVDGYHQMHPLFNHLFNSYYEGAGERTRRHGRGNMSRPSVDEVYAYRHHVDEHMDPYAHPHDACMHRPHPPKAGSCFPCRGAGCAPLHPHSSC